MNWGKAGARFFLIVGLFWLAAALTKQTVEIVTGADVFTTIDRWATSLQTLIVAGAWTYLDHHAKRDSVHDCNSHD